MSEKIEHVYDRENRGEGVLVIYTGGTIGTMHSRPLDPTSPLTVVSWQEFRRRTSSLSARLADGSPNPRYIGFNVDGCSLTPVDSCNIGPDYWVEIARVIHDSYEHYDGFVVLHGTDTMVYTASALSFMLEGLDKPVVLTGAQLSHLANVRNDALQNLLTALMIASPASSGLPVVPEVSIFFHEVLLRGNRSRKVTSSGLAAFASPDYPPLATAGETIVVDRRVIRPAGTGGLRLRSRLDPNVISVIFFPGIQESSILETLLSTPTLRGVVLMTYGAGNAPDDERVLGPIAAAVKRGVVAVAVTQCTGGRVELGRYEASARLLEVGVLSGHDMTPEAALVKLMVLLGDENLSPADVLNLVGQDLAGELSVQPAAGRGFLTSASRPALEGRHGQISA
uniref:asparaginase n=1 Tax=candidate division WOR-3 bacterium TaxID=2052148 RepID=A0A7C4CDM5_UNCW3